LEDKIEIIQMKSRLFS